MTIFYFYTIWEIKSSKLSNSVYIVNPSKPWHSGTWVCWPYSESKQPTEQTHHASINPGSAPPGAHCPESESGMRVRQNTGVSTAMSLSSLRWRGISVGVPLREQLRANKRRAINPRCYQRVAPRRRTKLTGRTSEMGADANRDPNQKLRHSRLEEVIKHDSE